ncbi:MAG: triose-phosphate isomerase [Hyphomicrobiales bacterium]|nr:triose-phosphate isomerase [Hyphomicrobiales bacterium]
MQYNLDVPIIAGNWKMNGLINSQKEIKNLINFLKNNKKNGNVIIFPPFTLISDFKRITINSNLGIGAQDCHYEEQGAYTGSISPMMIKDAGCTFVIVGHSEIRESRNESSGLIKKKSENCHNNNLITIICVGEDYECRMKGEHYNFISKQLFESIPTTANVNNTIIAYEPIWAIGSGESASSQDIKLMHQHISDYLMKGKIFNNKIPNLLYGGSVNSNNSNEILSINNVNGALVGGGSLDSNEFIKIIQSI